MIIVY